MTSLDLFAPATQRAVTIVGIDPGLGGGIAFLSPDGTCEAMPAPVFDPKSAKRTLDAVSIAALLGREAERTVVFIERAQAMPDRLKNVRQGSASTFNYGVGFGIYLGIIATIGLEHHLVMPGVWKKALKVGKDKELARQAATRLLPRAAHQWRRKLDHGPAEAALIALYGAQQLGVIRVAP